MPYAWCECPTEADRAALRQERAMDLADWVLLPALETANRYLRWLEWQPCGHYIFLTGWVA